MRREVGEVARPGWYVVQVETGRELVACDIIRRACELAAKKSGAGLLDEVFAPGYRSRFKRRGAWLDEERLLLPGYVVAVTDDPWELVRVLRGVPAFTRVLRAGETIVPLGDEDREWIERWTAEGDRTIPMSIGHKEGDRVVVTEGPLRGREAMIKRIKRRLCLAELEIHVGQVTVRTTVGLAVLPSAAEA